MYLQGRPFVLQTDHCPLTFLRACKDPRGRLARWILELEQFPYCMVYRPGRDIPHADALSRSVTDPVVGHVELKPDELKMLLAQRSDRDILQMIVRLLYDVPDPVNPSVLLKQLHSIQAELEVDASSGLLYVNKDGRRKLVVPAGLVQEILSEAHDSPWSGHLGVTRTLEKVKERFFWPGMTVDVSAYVKSCSLCSQKKSPTRPFRACYDASTVASVGMVIHRHHWSVSRVGQGQQVHSRGDLRLFEVGRGVPHRQPGGQHCCWDSRARTVL